MSMSQAGNCFADFAPGQVICIMVYKRAHAPQGALLPAPNIPGQ